MTNQTIDGVPREHLAAWAERLERADSGFPGSVPFLKELRALLDAPGCKTCKGTRIVSDGAMYCSSGGIPFESGPIECVKDCPDCKPAAQPQGEPVADLIRLDRSYRNGLMAGFQFGITGDEKGYAACIQRYNEGIQAAKAEQPAPVAVVLPKRRAVSTARDQAMCANSWNACLDELKRLNGEKP